MSTAEAKYMSLSKAVDLFTYVPFVGIVYENIKKERRVMNVDELQNFCDATLERVLNKTSATNVEARDSFKDPPLNEKDKELMVLLKKRDKNA
ncbi:hypothetical protein Tco_1386406 [Tanacetum coccineum]